MAPALERGGGPAPAGGGGGARSRYRRRSRSGGPRAAAATAAAGGRDRTRYGGARGPIRTGERRGDRGGGGSALDRAPLRRLAGGPPPGRRAGLGARLGSGAALTAKIAVLSQQVADQIAAGEVVERPASVVKELVENALDAGARAIRVEIENGGKTLIRVSDDGEGMSRGDAELALARHATSKIRDAADLIGVGTFGFRGEALPAIASVSRFDLETSPDGRSGTRIRVVGGKCEAVEDAVRQHGTTVTVRALFFNTPARRKFLRAQATETRAAAEVLTLLALARPDVAFRLASDDRVLIDVPPAEQAIDRLHGLWGRELASTLVAVAHREGPLEVRGFAQRPAQAKPAGRRGCVFVRGRPIRDPFILRAAEAGYRSTIAPGDRPSLILFLDLPGDAVDVNVHPAKLEVRFRDKFFVEKVVEEAVRRALGPLAAAAPLGTGGEVLGASGVWTELGAAIPAATTQELFRTEPLAPSTQRLAPLLQVFDTYILFQTDSGLAIVDQHSAHERVLYESVMRHLQGDGAPAQRLLLPLTLEFAPPELEAIAAHGEALRRVGYEIEPLSGRTVVVHTAPNPHPRFDAARCLQELVADLAGGRFGALANRLERFAATFACHAAVKAGQRLEPEETRELVMRLLTATLPAHDVHGRPTIVQLPRGELERRFGRG
ncbi:MAG: DNA mismatch repair endonuclease MutL [Gemmatimonadetes bacterium]|nr:MAG: DNA mismatch repair endonuclease MutL [Gemmatimonadota bacterium]